MRRRDKGDMTMPRIPCNLLLVLGLMLLVAGGCGEQQEPTPPASPVVVRKKVEAPQPPAAQAVKPSDQEAPEAPEKPPVEEAKVEPAPPEAEPEPLEAEVEPEPSPEGPEEILKKAAYVYDPKGKIDPFQSLFVTQPSARRGTKVQISARERKLPLTPLQKIDLSQLKVVGIIISATGNKALIEEPSGKGYVVTKGIYVGANFGQVKRILRDRVIVEEEVEDFFTGQMKLQTVDLILQKKLGEL
jgi:type IV pilus assembly protein PilP